MVKINLIGTILDSSGYSMHTRNLLNSLMKYSEVKLISQIMPGQEIELTDKELSAVKSTITADINLIVTMPIYWRMYSTNKRNWAYLVWEGDKIPKSWINECLNPEIEYILCPSEHTKTAILNTFKENHLLSDILDKIKVVPHGVNLDLFYPTDKPTDKFRFIANKGFRNIQDRGGVQYLIKAYLEEFDEKDNVELIVKINPAYGIPDIKAMFPTPPKCDIKFITSNMRYSEMVKLYNQGHVFVSPTRAESFNIPCLEAMACKLPVITTNYGGQSEYVDNENGWVIGGELTEVKWEMMYEGVSWLTPDVNQLRKAMREAYENKEMLKAKSEKAYNDAKLLTWDETAKKIINLE